jgi:hypothetical protein
MIVARQHGAFVVVVVAKSPFATMRFVPDRVACFLLKRG